MDEVLFTKSLTPQELKMEIDFVRAILRLLLTEGLSGPNTSSKNDRLTLSNGQIWKVTYALW